MILQVLLPPLLLLLLLWEASFCGALFVTNNNNFLTTRHYFGNDHDERSTNHLRYSRTPLSAFQRQNKQTRIRTIMLMMVRNIDLPEAVILYGSNVIVTKGGGGEEDDDEVSLRPGLEALLHECQADEAAVLALLPSTSSLNDDKARELLTSSFPHVTCQNQTIEPPNPHDLLQAIASVEIQPKPFGGSAGFGQRQFLDPPRSPLPARTVVLTHTLDQTRASRLSGMRVVRLMLGDDEDGDGDDDDDDDDPLADYVVDNEIDFGIDDISTPGSFWLNPPHPRDDQGNKVDPYELARAFTTMEQPHPEKTNSINPETTATSDIDDEELIRRMLADIDPL